MGENPQSETDGKDVEFSHGTQDRTIHGIDCQDRGDHCNGRTGGGQPQGRGKEIVRYGGLD